MELSRPRTMLSFENPQFLPNNYETKGGFTMKIKTEIRYVIMCFYLNSQNGRFAPIFLEPVVFLGDFGMFL